MAYEQEKNTIRCDKLIFLSKENNDQALLNNKIKGCESIENV